MRRARRQDRRGLAEHGGVGGADRHRAAALEEARAVGPQHERRRMARGAEGDLARLAVEHEVEHGRHHLLDAAHHEPVDAGHHLGGRRLDQPVGPERVAELAHRRRGAQAVAGHVAHHERDAPVGALEDVVPVAADGGAARARQVARRQLEAVDRRQPLGQQAALERLRDPVLALVDLEQARLHRLALVDVDGGADVAHELVAHVAGHAAVVDPAVLARVVVEPVLALPRAGARRARRPRWRGRGRRRRGARRAPSSRPSPPGRSSP